VLQDPGPRSLLPDAETACAEARRAREALDLSVERLRVLRRQLVDAGRIVDAAAADADRHTVAARKDELRGTWHAAMEAAPDEAERQEATAAWLRAITDTNHRMRLALRQLADGRRRVALLELDLRAADLEAAAARIRTEAADAACTDARARRAAAEEAAVLLDGRDRAAVVAAAGGDPLSMAEEDVDLMPDDPDVLETPGILGGGGRAVDSPTVRRLLAGDPATHTAIATELAEMSGQLPARYLLLLEAFVDELSAAAIDAGELAFDRGHPLWNQFSPDEARLVIRGLRDLGFRLDLQDGWFGGRAPTAADLASALGFAGYDVRSLRAVPSGEQLRELPASVQIAVLDHLRRVAPDLTLEQVLRAVGGRAANLGELWDEWGRIRPLLVAGAPLEGVAAAARAAG
jgi:hypothetical protein